MAVSNSPHSHLCRRHKQVLSSRFERRTASSSTSPPPKQDERDLMFVLFARFRWWTDCGPDAGQEEGCRRRAGRCAVEQGSCCRCDDGEVKSGSKAITIRMKNVTWVRAGLALRIWDNWVFVLGHVCVDDGLWTACQQKGRFFCACIWYWGCTLGCFLVSRGKDLFEIFGSYFSSVRVGPRFCCRCFCKSNPLFKRNMHYRWVSRAQRRTS